MFWVLHHHFPADPFLSPNLGLPHGPQALDGPIQLFYNYKLAEALNNVSPLVERQAYAQNDAECRCFNLVG